MVRQSLMAYLPFSGKESLQFHSKVGGRVAQRAPSMKTEKEGLIRVWINIH